MLPLVLGIAGLLAGATKAGLAADKAKRQRKLQAETTRYSPWTGMKGAEPESPNWVGDMLQGSMSGASFGQGLEATNAANARAERLLQLKEKQAAMNPWMTIGDVDTDYYSGYDMNRLG